MAEITSYPSGTLNLNDYFISTVQWSTDRTDAENVTRNFKVSEVVNTILAALNIGTVTSIATASSEFINVTGGTITTTGTITADLSATGTPSATTFLRGDGTWSLPGPAASTVAILYNGTQLTSDVNSINYTGSVTAVAANSAVTLNIPGSIGSSVDSVIAGTAISVNAPTGNVTITNTGVTQARAGGNITLSGGTGSVTVSTTANAGTVSSVSPGLGIATIANNTSNPEIDLEFTGANNYISRSETPTTANPEDFIEFNQLSSSNVKSVEIGDIPVSILTAINKYIDDEDADKLKNDADTYTSTEKALNMVSLTITEYNALVSGGTVDENTLYFIVGAGTAFTVNPVVTNNITGDVGYSINTTPSSVTGVSGTPYTFTTTVTVQPGGSFSGTNPVVTSDVINNSSGNPYNKSITVAGVYTAPAANSVRARLGTIALDQDSSGAVGGSNLAANSANRTYGGNIVGDVNPAAYSTANPTSYSFASTVSITDTNTYEFTVGPTIIDAAGNLTPTTPSQDIDVTTYMHGTVALKTYTVDLAVTNSITVTGAGAGTPTYNMDFISTGSQIQSSSISQAGGTISNAITGLNQSDTFGFSLNNLNWTLPADYTWSVSPTLTVDSSSSPISGANGTAAVTVSGTILYTAPVGVQYRKLDATAVIQAAVTGYANGTINNAVQTTNGVSGTFTYTVPTITANEGYYLTGGVVTLATNPITFNSTPGQSGAGTSGDPLIENNPTVTSGTINVAQSPNPQVIQTTYSGAPIPTYTTTFTGDPPVGTGSGNINTTGTQTLTGSTFNIGDGQVLVSVAKTSSSGNAIGPVTITWPDASQTTIAEGAAVGTQTKTVTIAQGASASVTINESIPVNNVTSTLVLNTSGVTGTEFTNSGDASGATNVAAPGTTQSFSPNLVANTDYQFTSGPTYAGAYPTYTQPNVSGNETINVTGVVEAIPYTVTLAYANGITGGTAGVEYTLSPASGTTRTGGIGSAYTFGTITATPASGYYFSTPFNATQTAFSLPIIGTMPSGGGTASQTLTGVIALARATIESVCVAVPTTTAITYATSFAPGGSGATRILTTTGTQTLSNSAFEYGNGTVTVTVNRTAPSSSAQDGGSIQWNLNGVQQGALQTITIGATISYSRTITGVTAGDTISVSIAEG